MILREIITVIIQTKDFKEKIPEKENTKLSLCIFFITCFQIIFL